MKTQGTIIILSILMFGMFGCKKPEGKKTEAKEAQEVKKEQTAGADTYKIQPRESELHWTGTKPTGQHNGTVKIKEGTIKMNDQGIQNATVVFDMTQIVNKDLEKENMKKKLEDHLKSKDFFDVKNHPEARFELTNASKLEKESEFTHKISGNLTIKDISKNISFKVKVNEEGEMARIHSEKFLIDRTKWDVNYKSKSVFDDLKEGFIHDDIEIKLKTMAKK
jgi:polyisoprenoid-binding protein YceI